MALCWRAWRPGELARALQGSARWQARCLQRADADRATLACALVPDGAAAATQLVALVGEGGGPWQGYRVLPGKVGGPGAAQWAPGGIRGIIGVDGREAGAADQTLRYTYGLKYPDAQGHPTAHFMLALPPALTVPEGMAAAEVEALAVGTLAIEIAGDLRNDPGVNGTQPRVFLDGYPLLLGPLRAPLGGERGLEPLARVSAPHAAALQDLVTRGARLRLDRAVGTRVQRHGDLGRVAIELSGGAVSAPGVAGEAPGGVDGFQIQVAAGLRLAARTHLVVGIGVESGLMDAEALEALPGAHRASSGGFSLGLHLRHSLDPGWGVEPVLGVQVRGRARSVELEPFRVDDAAIPLGSTDGLQAGLGLAPTVGLQVPWTVNAHDTRLVFCLEAAPEWTMWTSPRVNGGTEPNPFGVPQGVALAAELDRAMGSDDIQITTQLGVRFEL